MAALKRFGLGVLGWVLLVVGVAALVLPGPGLILVFAGLAVLSQRYEWAARRLAPVKYRALKSAAQGVSTPPRIALSLAGVAFLWACGVLWAVQPDVPPWWPTTDSAWLPGGWATGVTLMISGAVALGLLVYSYRRFHGHPEELAVLEVAALSPPPAGRPPRAS